MLNWIKSLFCSHKAYDNKPSHILISPEDVECDDPLMQAVVAAAWNNPDGGFVSGTQSTDGTVTIVEHDRSGEEVRLSTSKETDDHGDLHTQEDHPTG